MSTETQAKPEPPVDMRLEMQVSSSLVDWFTMNDPQFRVGDRRFRLAYLEEVSDEIADEDMLVLIDPASGDLFEVEVEVFVRKLAQPTPDEPVVDPNQITIDEVLS